MINLVNRRSVVLSTAVLPLLVHPTFAVEREIWAADEAQKALDAGEIVMIDVRTRGEWQETGVAQGAWAISMHEPRFKDRLFAARDFAKGAPVALICAVGGRTGRIMHVLKNAGYTGFIDVSEGMMGSKRGPGWIARGLPVVDMATALADLPDSLA